MVKVEDDMDLQKKYCYYLLHIYGILDHFSPILWTLVEINRERTYIEEEAALVYDIFNAIEHKANPGMIAPK